MDFIFGQIWISGKNYKEPPKIVRKVTAGLRFKNSALHQHSTGQRQDDSLVRDERLKTCNGLLLDLLLHGGNHFLHSPQLGLLLLKLLVLVVKKASWGWRRYGGCSRCCCCNGCALCKALRTVIFVVDVMGHLLQKAVRSMLEQISGQSYKGSTIVNYDSRVVPDWKTLHITTLES